jgi:Xaa-Pro dipeptidase
MSQYGIKALVASSRVNIAYLTGFDCWLYRDYWESLLVLGSPRLLKEQYAILPVEKDPMLVIDTYSSLYASELEDVELHCYGSWTPKIKKRAHDLNRAQIAFFQKAVSSQALTPTDALVEALKKAGATRGKVGVELSTFRQSTLTEVQKALPDVEFLNCQELLGLIRMVKTPEERAKLLKACEINENALHKSLERARDGVKISKLAQVYLNHISKEGAMFDHYFYCPDGLYLSAAPNYRLLDGEYTMIDSGCTYDLYYGDMATSLLVGKRRKDVMERYENIWDTIEEVADSVQPGTLPTEIVQMFGRLYEKRGLRDVDYQGHGIGLEPREFPVMLQGGAKTITDGILNISTDVPLEPGMVISLEGSVYEFGEGSFEVERTFLVEKSSLKEITSKKRNRSIFLSS